VTLAPTGAIVEEARAAGRGVGAFNVVQLEHAEAIVAGAEAAGAPVILQISHNCVRYHGSLEPLGAATLAAARQAAVPVAVHLDHAETAELALAAVELGFTSVMFDASSLPYDDNVAATREVATACRARGAWVEAELGEIGGKGGAHRPGVRTDPEEAAAFVEATGVDALAVAVGTSHAMVTQKATLDFDLIAALRKSVPVPLVLHGSSGVPDADLVRAVDAGLTKINIATRLNTAFTRAVRAALAADPDLVDPRRYLAPARDAVTAEVTALLRLLTCR